MDADHVRNGDPAGRSNTNGSSVTNVLPVSTTDLKNDQTETPKSVEAETVSAESPAVSSSPSIELKVTHNKKLLDIIISPEKTVRDLKDMLTVLSGIPADKQKIMWSKGACTDNMTLEALGAKNGSKFMMVGSSNSDVTQAQTKPDAATLKALEEADTVKIGEEKLHRKILEKGIPSDAMPGILGETEPLPPHPISGMVNKRGAAVRLTFKLELNEVWLGTKERTEKLSLGQIRRVIAEPILGHEEYYVVGLQVGTTEQSTYWFYWFPCQYVEAIREIFSQFD